MSVPGIYVLAGVNGAGKSSIAGAAVRDSNSNYYNPDEWARKIATANPRLTQTEANAAAWQHGRALLESAIAQRIYFAFETTLAPAPFRAGYRRLHRAALTCIFGMQASPARSCTSSG